MAQSHLCTTQATPTAYLCKTHLPSSPSFEWMETRDRRKQPPYPLKGDKGLSSTHALHVRNESERETSPGPIGVKTERQLFQ